MRIEDLKTGLYFILPVENLEKTAGYGNKYNKQYPHDQRYKYYTAVKNKEEWYMINTYQLSYFYVKGSKNINEYLEKIEQNQTRFCHDPYNYYYTCRIELTQEVLDLFDFVFDLRNYKILDKEEAEEYSRKDLLNVQLYREHNYPSGILIAEKNTQPDVRQQQIKILRDLADSIKAPSFNHYTHDKYIDKLENLEGVDKGLLKETKIWINKIKEMSEEINKLQDSFEWINPQYGTIKWDKLEEFLEG